MLSSIAVGPGSVDVRYSAPAKTASEIIADLMREIIIDMAGSLRQLAVEY